MFWGNTSFCMLLSMLTAAEEALMRRWEADMKAEGLQVAMATQRFYREPGHEQPMELFLIKAIEGAPPPVWRIGCIYKTTPAARKIASPVLGRCRRMAEESQAVGNIAADLSFPQGGEQHA